MSFLIPNDVVGGTAEQHAQASPDAGDFAILVDALAGNGVVSGCAVTQGTGMAPNVASGSVQVGGAAATVTGGTVTVTTADATNPRFDLVVVNSSGTKSVTAGTAAATPVFPAIPATSVVLAAIYVGAGVTSIMTADIIDKRSIIGSAVLLTADVIGILPTANGGTGIAYFTAAGPTVARVYTFPDAAATMLTSAAAVTLGQGGTQAALTASVGGIVYSQASALAILAGTATANKVLLSASSAAPVWSTPTFPNASATSRKIIVSDGTNWVASTETYAVPGTSGNVLTSNGTNWTSAAAAGGLSVTTKGDLQGYSTVAARVPIGTNGAHLVADSGASLGLSWLLPAGASVATSQSTTSASYTDLTTPGPAVTVTIGASGMALVFVTAEMTFSASAEEKLGRASVAVSGATTVAAADSASVLIHQQGNSSSLLEGRETAVTFLTGLTAGSNTFTMKYKSNAQGGNFLNRHIAVIPL